MLLPQRTRQACLSGLCLALAVFAPSMSFAVGSSDESSLAETEEAVSLEVSAGSNEQVQRQLIEMQQKMEAMERDYARRMQEMQATIAALSAHVKKEGVALPESAPLIDPEDRDIGEELIFEAEENPSLLNQPLLAQDQALNSGSQISSAQTGNFWNRAQQMNPDISVIGDTIGYYSSRSSDEGRNRFSLREMEIALQAAIDPYARADFFLTKPDDEEFEIEEGYVTFLALPYGFQSKIGKFRSAIGRLNRVHGPELPQTDRPNVLTNFFGDEGMAETGVNVSKILPLPWYSILEVEAGNGDNDVLFGAGTLARPLIVSRLGNYVDLTTNTNLQLGFSGAFGSAPENDLGVRRGRYRGIQGVDLTYRWVPPKINRSFVWQTELLAAQLEHPAEGRNNLFGGYSFVETQLTRRWFAGLRLDYSQVPFEENVTEWAFAPYVNFWQSEFGRLRLEYKHTFRKNALSSDQAWVQYTFTIGEHRPHPF